MRIANTTTHCAHLHSNETGALWTSSTARFRARTRGLILKHTVRGEFRRGKGERRSWGESPPWWASAGSHSEGEGGNGHMDLGGRRSRKKGWSGNVENRTTGTEGQRTDASPQQRGGREGRREEGEKAQTPRAFLPSTFRGTKSKDIVKWLREKEKKMKKHRKEHKKNGDKLKCLSRITWDIREALWMGQKHFFFLKVIQYTNLQMQEFLQKQQNTKWSKIKKANIQPGHHQKRKKKKQRQGITSSQRGK